MGQSTHADVERMDSRLITRNSIATEMNVFGYATICEGGASQSRNHAIERAHSPSRSR